MRNYWKFVASGECTGENEQYKTGLSSSCGIPTCENKESFKNKLRPCTADAVNACVCVNNTFRHSNGKCIKPEDCPSA